MVHRKLKESKTLATVFTLKKPGQTILEFIISLSIAMFLVFPNYYASLVTPPGKVYTGQAFRFDNQDISVYVAAINWSQKFGLNFQNAYEIQPHRSVIFYPLYTPLGMVLPGVNPILIYNISVGLVSLMLVLLLFRISAIFITDFFQKAMVVFLTIFGGGLGLIFLAKFPAADVYSPVTFLSTMQRPHEMLALSFYIMALCLFFLGVNKKDPKSITLSSIFSILFTIFYPYHLLGYYLICFVYALVFCLKHKVRYPIVYFVKTLIITLSFGIPYSFYLLSATQFKDVTHPPFKPLNLLQIMVGYGILTPVILYQVFKGKRNDSFIFLNLWFFLSVLLSFLPLGLSRYYLRGLYFPAVILVIRSLSSKTTRFESLKTVFLTLVLIIVPSYGILLTADRIQIAKGGENRWYYITEEEKEAINFLKETPEQTGVLTQYLIGNLIPVYTYNRVYLGHQTQTPDAQDKFKKMIFFYSNAYSPQEAYEFLKKNGISYVFWGPDEAETTRQLSGENNLKYNFLKPLYSNSKVTVFQVP